MKNGAVITALLLAGPWLLVSRPSPAQRVSPHGEGRAARGPYLGESPPGDIPVAFGRPLISTPACEHGALAIRADGRELAWSVFDRPALRQWILSTHEGPDGAWTAPVPAPFTDHRYRDGDPSFSRDGRSLYFLSNRAAEDGSAKGREDMWLWVVERDAHGWRQPKPVRGALEGTVTLAPPAFARDGSFYTAVTTDPGSLDIHYVRRTRLGFLSPAPIAALNSDRMEEAPFLSADETMLLFASNRPGGSGGLDLYVSVRTPAGGWSVPANLGSRVNSALHDRSPSLSPDGRYLFFLRGQAELYDYYWVDARVLRR